MDVALEYIHSHGDANIMIASHNIDSIKVNKVLKQIFKP